MTSQKGREWASGAPSLPEPRTAYRVQARSKYRTAAREDAREPVNRAASATSVATSAATQLQMAKNLMALGNDEHARNWLLKVADMKTSESIAREVCQLLCEIEERIGPVVPKTGFARER